MREPAKVTETGYMDDVEWLQSAILAHKPERVGDKIILHHKGRSVEIHPLTASIILSAWAEAISGAYTAATGKTPKI